MSSDDIGAPFVGPRPFERRDAGIFFGRKREVSELLSLVIAYRIVLIYAVSGAGKTSLLNAGLIPGLEEEGFEVLPVARVRGLKADAALPSVPKNVYVFNVLSNWSQTVRHAVEVIARPVGSRPTTPVCHTTLACGPAAPTGKLTEISLAEDLARRPHPVGTDGFAAPRTVIFDQFEELFSLHPEHWRHRAAFFEQIAAALRDNDLLRVVFALREEYLAELDRYHFLLPRGVTARFRLTRLGSTGALDAVTKPVEPTTRSFAPGVAEKLVSNLLRLRVVSGTGDSFEVEGEFVEPVQLQVVCRSLWDKLPPDVSVIDERHLLRCDVDDVLGRFYSDAIEAAARKTNIDERELRVWVEEQFITRDGTRGTVYHTRDSTAGMPNAVIDELEARHLIRAEWRWGARWYELTHDRFIGPIRASNRASMYRPLSDDAESAARLRARQALARAEAAWQESLAEEARASQEEAMRIYESIGDRSAKANTLIRMAELSYRKKELIRARELAQEAHHIYTDVRDALGVADALRAMGRVDVGLGNHDSGVDLLTKARDIYLAEGQSVGAAWTLLTMSEGRHLSGQTEEAVAVAERALTLFRASEERAGAAATLLRLGEFYVEAGRPDDAREKYDAARQIYWELADLVSASAASAQIGYILCEAERYEEAVDRFTQAIRLFSGDVYPYLGRASAYLYAERYREAVEDFTRVLGWLDQDGAAHAGRGHALAALGQLDSALAEFVRALELASDDRVRASARNGRGFVLGEKGQFEEAMREFSAALELSPDDGFIYYNRALLHQRLGDARATKEHLTAALHAGDPRLSGPKRARAEGML